MYLLFDNYLPSILGRKFHEVRNLILFNFALLTFRRLSDMSFLISKSMYTQSPQQNSSQTR